MSKYHEFFSHHLIRFVMGMSLVGVVLTCVYFNGYVTILSLVLGALVFVVSEYLVHRYVLHELPWLAPALHRGHDEHHQHPMELKYLFGPVHYDILLYSAYIPLVWLIFRELSVVVAVVTGTLLYQLYYQWMHYVAHRPIVPLTPWGKWMKRKHLLHHYKDEAAWYGVSNPVMDYLLGTNKERER
ncbi:sterol desaturase family protein [Brevibacillus marinus]|uniref:sterol desaturase family protein n=1 Tax=Brevibacillus marinus TaxID=2496837 RepID=UPI000F84BCD3|nr:sterol desaturase family protein [Brevibacillus marinus]